MGLSAFRVVYIGSIFGLVCYIILYKSFESNLSQHGVKEGYFETYLYDTIGDVSERQHMNNLETKGQYKSDYVSLTYHDSEHEEFNQIFNNTSQYDARERVFETYSNHSKDYLNESFKKLKTDGNYESGYVKLTDQIELGQIKTIPNNTSLDIETVEREVLRVNNQKVTRTSVKRRDKVVSHVQIADVTKTSQDKVLSRTQIVDVAMTRGKKTHAVNVSSIKNDEKREEVRDCKNLITKLPATKMRPSPRKKQIVWLDIHHNGHGLRSSVENARFHYCKGVARNCEIMPSSLVKGFSDNVAGTMRPLAADAVIFQGCHFPLLPLLKRRDNNQVFVLAERENWWAGKHNRHIDKTSKSRTYSYYINKFNWTMTYRYDSDIILPYGQIIPNHNFKNTHIDYASIYKKKRFPIVWFVSHCDTKSLREVYVQELMQYIPVHIYGACGKHKCPKHNQYCFNHVIKTYKFVLSFENTYQTNYVTEKLFNWFPHQIVPVVRGGETNYSRHGVPDGTIIDADKFANPKDLAGYLLRIGNNEKKYTNMLKKKAGYLVISKAHTQQQAYCNLCEKLNTLDEHRQCYNDIGYWFVSKYNTTRSCKTDSDSVS